MLTDVIQDGFSAPFSDLIDKNLFEVFKVEGENRWVVRRIKGEKTIENNITRESS